MPMDCVWFGRCVVKFALSEEKVDSDCLFAVVPFPTLFTIAWVQRWSVHDYFRRARWRCARLSGILPFSYTLLDKMLFAMQIK